MHRISKSRILSNLQCAKRLWLQTHRPELAKVSADLQDRFDVGHRVGELARNNHEGGLLIDAATLEDAIERSAVALTQAPRPLFEATFEANGVLIRADLLLPGAAGYRLVEVKASTKVAPHHVADAAIQAWVIKHAGVALESVEVACIDTTFSYPGNDRYEGLLKVVDVTEQAALLEQNVSQWVDASLATIAGPEPIMEMGAQCTSPYPCPFSSSCSPSLHHEGVYPVELLPNHRGLANELRAEGYADIRDIPACRLQHPSHERIRRVTASGIAELNLEAAKIVSEWAYPRYFIDFETLGSAIPAWPGIRPYEAIPFQWSCHRQDANGQWVHMHYLPEHTEDPRAEFAATLIAAVGESGPIIVYNAGTERCHLQSLARHLPSMAPFLASAVDRIVDLLPIARKNFYHPAMRGSWSIKSVLRAIAPELTYDLLTISNGLAAQRTYQQLLSENFDSESRQSLRSALLQYCERDTWAMVTIARFFSEAFEFDA